MPFSSVIQLLGFGAISYGVSLEAGAGWGLITGGLAVVFIGHYWEDGATTRAFRIFRFRVRNFVAHLRQIQAADEQASPHPPPIQVDPEMEAFARRAAEKRVARGYGHYTG